MDLGLISVVVLYISISAMMFGIALRAVDDHEEYISVRKAYLWMIARRFYLVVLLPWFLLWALYYTCFRGQRARE
jgi:uncharacterized BrkB/YihY/UPF0761 family membrane protein